MQVQVEKDGKFTTYLYDPAHLDGVKEFYEEAYQNFEIESYIISL